MCMCMHVGCVESLAIYHDVCMWRGSLLNAVGGESSEKIQLNPYN